MCKMPDGNFGGMVACCKEESEDEKRRTFASLWHRTGLCYFHFNSNGCCSAFAGDSCICVRKVDRSSNTACRYRYSFYHSVCFYVDTGGHRIEAG